MNVFHPAMMAACASFTTVGPLESLSLTDVDDGRVFQRAAGNTSGPIILSGTYVGGAPSSVEARVLDSGDDSTVVDWTALTGGSISGGNWSGRITTPQGGPYYVEVRASDATEIGDQGENDCFVGVWLVLYGQSNCLNMSTTNSSPPAAAEGTGYYNGSAFSAVASGNGIRELLNGIRSATGIPVAAFNASVPGVSIAALMEGDASGHFAGLAADLAAIGGDAEFIVWHHGEGDSAGATSEANYKSRLSTLHQSICDEAGRTKAQMPLVLSSLATCSGASGFGTDATWAVIQTALVNAAAEQEHVHYSHSNMDATLVDEVHWDAASYGRCGKRLVQTIAVLLGDETDAPKWFATAAARVDATHTDVTVVHSMGSDFTPTTDITGFEVSDDNGASWEAATGARQDSTTIRLTHADLGTVERKVRYQFGRTADVDAPVIDDGTLTVPLNFTATELTAEGAAALPVPTFIGSAGTSSSGQTQTAAGFNIGTAAEDRLVIVAVSNANSPGGGVRTDDFQSVTLKVSGEPDVNASIAVQLTDGTEDDRMAAIAYGIVPAGSSMDVEVAYRASPFVASRVHVWTVSAGDMNSTTPVDSDSSSAANATSASVDLSTQEGGFVIAAGVSRNFSASGAVSGNESFATRVNASANGGRHVGGDASGTAAGTNDNTVTCTWADVGEVLLVAAAWR